MTQTCRAKSNYLNSTSFLICIITAIGFGLRLKHLFDPIGWDEGKIAGWLAKFSILDILGFYHNIGNHIFFTLLCKVSVNVFGFSLTAIRLPAIVAGCALVPATYMLFSRICDKRVGLLAASLVASSSLLILASVNARGYILQNLLIIFWLIFAHDLATNPTKKNLVFYILSCWTASYTLPTSVIFVPGIAIWMFLLQVGSQKWTGILAGAKQMLISNILAGLLIVLSYGFAIYTTGLSALSSKSYFEQISLQRAFAYALHLPALLFETFHWDLPELVQLLLPWIALIGLLGFLIENRNALMLYLLLALSSVFVLCVVRLLPLERTLTFFLPLYFGAVAKGFVFTLSMPLRFLLDESSQRYLIWLAPVLCLVFSFYAINGVQIERAPGYSRPWGSKEMVLHFDSNMRESFYWANLYPQYSFWIHQLSNDRSQWRSSSPQALAEPAGQRLLIIVRNHREDIDTVIAFLKYRSLKDIDLSKFRKPKLIWEFKDTSVYKLTRKRES